MTLGAREIEDDLRDIFLFRGPNLQGDFRQMIRRKHRRKPGLCLVLPSKCTVSGSIRGTQMVNSVLAPL